MERFVYFVAELSAVALSLELIHSYICNRHDILLLVFALLMALIAFGFHAVITGTES